jgi:hypothetical protein
MMPLHDSRLELGERRERGGCGGDGAPQCGDAEGEIRRVKKRDSLLPSKMCGRSHVPAGGAGDDGDFLRKEEGDDARGNVRRGKLEG